MMSRTLNPNKIKYSEVCIYQTHKYFFKRYLTSESEQGIEQGNSGVLVENATICSKRTIVSGAAVCCLYRFSSMEFGINFSHLSDNWKQFAGNINYLLSVHMF